ncbi:HlyU family transcriptional regulator [Vibrio rarus]|uniref:HlyU family transcriptional regulator n=1 Tax=Vibrio rarus TaxID=413403 RepID=UPI0021C4B54D|nr:HlyU family transcriptional regulator [Vibrio rarus]
MGWLSRLFGSSNNEKKQEVEPVEYKGYLIYADSIAEGGQFRVAGRITSGEGDALKTHQFIRSDVLGSKESANELMLKKAQMYIDQTGESIFDQ